MGVLFEYERELMLSKKIGELKVIVGSFYNSY